MFDEKQQKKADFILANPHARLSSLLKHERKELAVVWCYYSGKIEGNTYSYVETVGLLKDDVTAARRYEDAKMLKNLYNGFVTVLEQITKGEKTAIDRRTVFTLHSMLTDGLVQDRERGTFRTRAVGITGTSYVPPTDPYEIQDVFEKIVSQQHDYDNPLERAVYLHCNMARLQPFVDGNKRTSRFLESIVLMNNNIIPPYSTKREDINAYRRAILSFYEKQDYTPYANYVLNRLIRRINSMSTKTEVRFNLRANKEI